MRIPGLLLFFFFFPDIIYSQRLSIVFLDNNWVCGGSTQIEIVYTSKNNIRYSTLPGIYGRYANRQKMRVVAFNAILEKQDKFSVDLTRLSPGDPITLSVTYTKGKLNIRKDTTFTLLEIMRIVPVYHNKDTLTPGMGVLKDAVVVFADGNVCRLFTHPRIANYFTNSSNYFPDSKAGIIPKFELPRHDPYFIWTLRRTVDSGIWLRDTLMVNYCFTYSYDGQGRHGRNGFAGSGGDDGKEGEHAGSGGSGENGGDGTHGADVNVYVHRLRDSLSICKVKIVSKERTTLAYVDLSCGGKIVLDLEGGSGGNGGDGGNGGNGGKGNVAEDKAPGNGGDGGYGGDGGNGGNGGSAIIYLDTFSFRYKAQVQVLQSGGKGGRAGSGGSSGNGAEGAKGGSSGSWGNSGRPGKNGKESVYLKWEE